VCVGRGGGVMVTAICTSKSELEFNALSARRYVSMAQRNTWLGVGIETDAGGRQPRHVRANQ